MSAVTFHYHPILRIAGYDPTALEVLAQALGDNNLPISGEIPANQLSRVDPYQVDPSLTVAYDAGVSADSTPVGTTYAGLTPTQRGAFLVWAQDPTLPAPSAFQRLLISHAEVALLEAENNQQELHSELIRWALAPTWRSNEWLARALLLVLWLSSNGVGIAEWTSAIDLPPDLLDLALGLQTLLHEELRAEQALHVLNVWNLPGADCPQDVLTLRLRSANDTLGKPPLSLVRDRLIDEDLQQRPWRTAHRDLRFSLPQPSIRQHLQPLLEDILTSSGQETVHTQSLETDTPPPAADRQWQLVLEFGQSRSDFYPHVLGLAQRMPGYMQLLDEDRRLVHRIMFQKREMRTFWRIWDYVQNWSTTHVYVNGQELEQWKVWPYSQYLR